MWRIEGGGGEKAVAGYDEDTVTMAAAAVLDCIKGSDKQAVLSTSPLQRPLTGRNRMRPIIASVRRYGPDVPHGRFWNSLRAGTTAMRAAWTRSGAARRKGSWSQLPIAGWGAGREVRTVLW